MIKNMFMKNKRIIIGIMLIAIGVILRITLHGNLPASPSVFITINGITQPMFMLDLFFVVAIISLLSGIILGGYYTFIIPISIMAISDIIIGQTWILLFVWSGFAIIGLIGYIMKKKNILSIKRTPTILGLGVGSILLYDIWTNFGTWLGGPQWGYTYTWSGLALCYTKALPFMFWHLLSTTIAIALIIIPVVYLKEHKLKLPEFTINPIERHVTIAVPAILMIIAIIMVFA